MAEIGVIDQPGCPSGLAAAGKGTTSGNPTAFVRDVQGEKSLELLVKGAKCAGCIAKIERAVQALPGVSNARLNLSSGKLSVSWQGDLEGVRITEALSALGYDSVPYDPAASLAQTDAYGRHLLRCLAIAGFATANVMLLSVGIWASSAGEMGQGTKALFHLVSALIAYPAVAFAGRPFFSSAIKALKRGRANMDVPVSLAVLLAMAYSTYETLIGHGETYFDAAVMLLFFLLIGRWLDHSLRNRARGAARDLIALQSVAASRMAPDGTVTMVSARDIAVDDVLLLSPGDRVPVNGRILEGASEMDRSLVTGESVPVTLHEGDTLEAGVLNLTSRIRMIATARVDDSLVADLARLVEAGQQAKGQFVRLADKASRLYVPVVHTLALATFAGWFFIGQAGLRVALMNAIAVLIITCPCALGLATPAVQVVATGRLFRKGMLVKSGDALERLAQASAVVFDKTGTLTMGALRLANRETIDAHGLDLAARLARTSHHPVSRAIVEAAGAGPVALDAVEVPGMGLEAVIDGVTVRLGRAEFVGVVQDSDRITTWLRAGDAHAVPFHFEDQIRPGTDGLVAALKARGIGVSMLSGDTPAAARRIAVAAGIEHWHADQRPADKVEILSKLANKGERVLMIGDGLNDAPALANAHVSISPGTATEAAQSAADFVFQGDDLGIVEEAMDVARSARRRVLENFGFAALYNAIAAPLAMAGFVTPLIAAIAMSGSSLIVILNAMRLNAGGKS